MSGGDVLLLGVLLLAGCAAWSKYNAHLDHLEDRDAALAEASHGAAMIVLPVVAYVGGIGAMLPPWAVLGAFAVMFWGGLRLYNGAKFSVGWRDPQLIARAVIKVGVGVEVHSWFPHGLVAAALVCWCLVTGITKLFLVLRGFPVAPWEGQKPDMPHGTAEFSGPGDSGWKL